VDASGNDLAKTTNCMRCAGKEGIQVQHGFEEWTDRRVGIFSGRYYDPTIGGYDHDT
jgi:hypothetical protein